MAFRGIQSTNIISTEVGLTDPLLILNKDSSTAVDVGFLGKIGSNAYAGLVKDSTTEDFILISSINLASTSVNSIDATDLSLVKGDLVVETVTGDLIGDVTGQVSDISNFNTDSLSQGNTNFYYTTTQANADFDTRIATKSTSDLDEGTNLYYTDARTDARVDLQVGTNLDLSGKSTSNLPEGTNLYYTNARTDARVDLQVGTNLDLSGKSTSNLPEGTNLYYTDARADARAQLKIDATVDSAPGTLDTLNELAAALGDDANFSTTVTNSIAAKLPLAGGVMTGDLIMDANEIHLADNGEIRLGNAADYKIYHDGGNSYIKNNTGWLNMPMGGSGVSIANSDFTERIARFLVNGACELYHNGSKKIETTASGVTMYEDTAATYTTTIQNTADNLQLLLGTTSGGLLNIQGKTINSNATYDIALQAEGGNVGIGTSSPSEKLHVFNSSTSWDSYSRIRIGTESSSYEGAIGYHRGTTTDSDRGLYLSGSGSANKHLQVLYNGNIGIGVTSPSSLLHLYDSTDTSSSTTGTTLLTLDNFVGSDLNQQKTFIDFRLFDTNTNETPQVRIGAEVGANTDANTQEMEGEGAFVVYTNDTSGTSGTATGLNERLRVSSNGNVGIGTSTPSSTLHVVGSILASGDITAYSDDSLKTNVQVIDNAVGKVEQLRGVTFDRIEDGSTSTGVIAQELKEVLPEAVHTDEQGVHSVAYGNVVGLLIEAIKEQQKQIDELIKANKS